MSGIIQIGEKGIDNIGASYNYIRESSPVFRKERTVLASKRETF